MPACDAVRCRRCGAVQTVRCSAAWCISATRRGGGAAGRGGTHVESSCPEEPLDDFELILHRQPPKLEDQLGPVEVDELCEASPCCERRGRTCELELEGAEADSRLAVHLSVGCPIGKKLWALLVERSTHAEEMPRGHLRALQGHVAPVAQVTQCDWAAGWLDTRQLDTHRRHIRALDELLHQRGRRHDQRAQILLVYDNLRVWTGWWRAARGGAEQRGAVASSEGRWRAARGGGEQRGVASSEGRWRAAYGLGSGEKQGGEVEGTGQSGCEGGGSGTHLAAFVCEKNDLTRRGISTVVDEPSTLVLWALQQICHQRVSIG